MVRGVCVCGVCVVCVCLFRLCHTQKNVDVTRVHVTPKNQRFRETEGFDPREKPKASRVHRGDQWVTLNFIL